MRYSIRRRRRQRRLVGLLLFVRMPVTFLEPQGTRGLGFFAPVVSYFVSPYSQGQAINSPLSISTHSVPK